jgi:nucleotide-binding universal stress UspA family protein
MKIEAFLPLVTYPEANSDAVAANAASVAALIDAELNALAIEVDIPSVSSPLSRLLTNVPEMIRDAELQSHARGEHLLARVTEQTGERGIPVTVRTSQSLGALLPDVATENARYYDLTMLGWEAGNETSRMVAEAVVFGAGRPVVLLPELTGISSLSRIALAWDGSRVAARALADAAVSLRQASIVDVLTVVDEKALNDKNISERLAEILRRKGLVVEAHRLNTEDCPIGVTLQDHAIESGAELLVMGAYGHSRLRQFVLGGATRDVLGDLRLPTLMSH